MKAFTLTMDLSMRVSAVANQLRLIQEQYADEQPQQRQERLLKAVERELKAIAPDHRQPFLKELGERFPAWETQVEVTAPGQATPVQSEADKADLDDWAFLLRRLLMVSERLSAEDRKALIQRLTESGLVPAAAATGSAELPKQPLEQIAKELGLPADKAIDAARLAELAAVLVPVVVRLEIFAWEQWRILAPQSQVRKPGNFKTDAAKFVTGEQRATDNSVAGDAKALQLLVAGMVQGVGNLGEDLYQSLFTRFSPAEIARRAKENKKFMESDDAASWRLYVELSAQLERASVITHVRESIRKQVESTPGIRR